MCNRKRNLIKVDPLFYNPSPVRGVAFLASMVLAEWSSAFREEALSLEVLLAAGAVEALTVVVVVQGLHPLVAGFDGESAGEALGREQFVPVGFAVRVTFLQEERAVAEQLATVGTLEALRMELLADCVQAVSLNSGVALAADGGQELLEAVLAVQVTLLLHESDVGQRAFAVAVVADEVIRAPDAAESGDKWTSDLLTAAATQWNTASWSDCLVHNTTTTSWGGGRTGCTSPVECGGTCTTTRSISIIVLATHKIAVTAVITEACDAVIGRSASIDGSGWRCWCRRSCRLRNSPFSDRVSVRSEGW